MFKLKKTTRRDAIKVGLASIASAAVSTPKSEAAIRPKARGETKVVNFGGDGLHNGLGHAVSGALFAQETVVNSRL